MIGRMVAVGLVLLVLAVLLTLGIVLFNGESYGAEVFGVTISNVSIGGLFLTGVITGVARGARGGAAARRGCAQAAPAVGRPARTALPDAYGLPTRSSDDPQHPGAGDPPKSL